MFIVQCSIVVCHFRRRLRRSIFNKTLREAPPSAKRKRDSAQPQTVKRKRDSAQPQTMAYEIEQ
jgi:hypothetical protein